MDNMFNFEEEYLTWTTTQENESYRRSIRVAIGRLGLSLSQIRRNILVAEATTLLTPIINDLKKNVMSSDLASFFQSYINAWQLHDAPLYAHASTIIDIARTDRCIPFFELLLENDARLRAIVSFGLEYWIDRETDRLQHTYGMLYLPQIRSFELNLLDTIDSIQTNEDLSRFADEFCYGDLDEASKEMRLKRSRSVRSRSLAPQPTDPQPEPLPCQILQRLHLWAGYYEPRKRYRIEGGIVDVLFREALLQVCHGRHYLVQYTSALLCPQTQLYNAVCLLYGRSPNERYI